MNIAIIIGTIISLIFGVVTYVSTSNLIATAVSFAISFIYFLAIAGQMIKKYQLKINRYHECYQFCNTFLVSLSIKGAIKSAIDSTMETMPSNFKKKTMGMEEFNEEEKLQFLAQYFKFNTYGLFLNIVNLWSEQGGDILDMASHLINETRLTEEYIVESNRLAIKHVLEFAILWVFSLVILVVLRFALSQFYEKMIRQAYFPFAVVGILMFALATIHVAIVRMCRLEIRGWQDGK
ncbi:MAG: hypothetical protein K6F07_02510 [Bacilli bacterium]|nr:hypothetical protein [Bacilli bacterium]